MGNPPGVGKSIRVDLFEPGIATYVPYGVYDMSIREIVTGFGVQEVIIDTEDMKGNKVSK